MIKYDSFTEKNLIASMLGREDSIMLTLKYARSRFGNDNALEVIQYMQTLINTCDEMFCVVRQKENRAIEVLGIALREKKFITLFSAAAHSMINFRFMQYIIGEMKGELQVYTTVQQMERMLTKLGFRMINFERGGRWYTYRPNSDHLEAFAETFPDGTIQ